MSPSHKPELPRKGKTPVVKVTLNVPQDLYNKMVKEGKLNEDSEPGLGWGELTAFINKAIEEKLERQKNPVR